MTILNYINKLKQPGVREIIDNNLHNTGAEFILRNSPDIKIPLKEIAEQIDCKRKAAIKLPSLKDKKLIYKTVPLEQCSSELTAEYKSLQISGKRIIDLTGGFGIDSIYFSRTFEEVIYCEENEELADIAEYNFTMMGISNISVQRGDSIKLLGQYSPKYFDWIYADPARRNNEKRSVDIKYYSPDVVSNMELFFSRSPNVLLKLAPAFDIKEAERIFPHMNNFSVVSVKNECKEVLLSLNKNNVDRTKSAVVLSDKQKPAEFNINMDSHFDFEINSPETGMYFYEPDASIRKADLTDYIAHKFRLNFINSNSHYLISRKKIKDFPGRKFKIKCIGSYNEKKIKKYLSDENITKANIARGHFPYKPETIKDKLKLKDGGEHYLFFTRDSNEKIIFLHTLKQLGDSNY